MVSARPIISKVMADPGRIVQGVMAINKPIGVSSAQVIRDMQKQFDQSKLFETSVRQSLSAQMDSRRGEKRKRRRGMPSVKIGHGGTLDVAARGVLVIGIGNGTKELSKFLECTKTYETIVLFGVATDTYDHVGKIVGKKPFQHISEDVVRRSLEDFRGKIMQRPPIFSALRIQGKRLFEFAREGIMPPAEIKERPVEVLQLDMDEWLDGGKHEYRWPRIEAEKAEIAFAEKLLSFGDRDDNYGDNTIHLDNETTSASKRKRHDSEDFLVRDADPESKRLRESSPALMSGALVKSDKQEILAEQVSIDADPKQPPFGDLPPAARIRMTVTSGFYVRSFCHDLGKAVGSFAIMADLVRTRQSDFELGKNVFEYEDLEKGEAVWGPQVDKMLKDWSRNGEE